MLCSLFLKLLLGSGILFIIKILLWWCASYSLLRLLSNIDNILHSFYSFSPHCMAAPYNISGESLGDSVVRGREVSDVNEGGFNLGNASWSPSPGISAALALVWSWTDTTPQSHGDVEKCCRCISWMQREVLVAKQEMRNPVSLN